MEVHAQLGMLRDPEFLLSPRRRALAWYILIALGLVVAGLVIALA
jgi:hypothetical protein